MKYALLFFALSGLGVLSAQTKVQDVDNPGRNPVQVSVAKTATKSLAAAGAIQAIDPMSRPAHSQALAAGRGLAVALAALGDREGALAQARDTIARANADAAVRSEKNLNALYAAKGWLALAAVHRAFSDWKAVQAAAERALQEAAGGGEDTGLLQASAEAQRLIAECRGRD